ncbi:hypothetical protein AQUSIP_06490 [Aquicella siphonis]|uniref:Uncharacterized protein n=1 Tax=Aquicella siphonis TaxID=254247 RepID=A0A5E4PEF2_9COXI|nr:hypothetical protein [Aquicella siphonis]VVC75359.1 hypothetical protein AQUSIP_06490 [Aquicella siphonis]
MASFKCGGVFYVAARLPVKPGLLVAHYDDGTRLRGCEPDFAAFGVGAFNGNTVRLGLTFSYFNGYRFFIL